MGNRQKTSRSREKILFVIQERVKISRRPKFLPGTPWIKELMFIFKQSLPKPPFLEKVIRAKRSNNCFEMSIFFLNPLIFFFKNSLII